MSARKKVRPGKLDLSSDGTALDVHYESLKVSVLPNGQEVVRSSKSGIKRINFELPVDGGSLQSLAQQIVEGCKLLHAPRLPEVQRLLELAAERHMTQAPGQASAPSQVQAPLDAPQQLSDLDRQLLRQRQQQYLQAAAASATQALAAAAATASLERLEEYLEALYEEDLGVKTAAAAAVAHLFRDARNLGVLQAHPTLLQALARLLREDAKKSAELAVSLLTVFFALSHLPHAHPMLVQNQVGSLTMELLDLELRRAEHWQQREGVAVADVGAKLLAGSYSGGGSLGAGAGGSGGEALTPAEQRLAVALARQEPLLYVGLSLLLNMAEADVGVEQKMVKKGLLCQLVVLLDRGSPHLLLVVATFLHKLSLFAENSRQLAEAEVVGQLATLVPGDGGPLLFAVLRLLHNLSFDEAMQQQMVAAGLIAKAAALLKLAAGGLGGSAPNTARCSTSSSRDGSAATVRSSGGGSRDGGSWRPGTATAGPLWPQQLQPQRRPLSLAGGGSAEGPQLRLIALRLLYHLSLQDKHRSMFLYTDAIATLHGMVMAEPPPLASSCPELAALLVSLASSTRVAEEMSRCGRLEQLLALVLGPAPPLVLAAVSGPAAGDGAADAAVPAERGVALEALQATPPAAAPPPTPPVAAGAAAAASAGAAAEDVLMWKLLRAMVEHDSEPLRARFAPAVDRIARLLMGGCLPHAVLVEALGCLACLQIPGFDYAKLLHSTQLHSFLAELAADGCMHGPEHDAVLLEVVIAAGVLCADAECAAMLAETGLVEVLHGLMLERMEDDSFALATTTTAARMLAQPSTRAMLLAHPEVAAHFAELLQHSSRELVRAADAALDAIAAGSEEWAASVRRLKFESHNREWLQIIQADQQPGCQPVDGMPSARLAQQRADVPGYIPAFWGAPAAAGLALALA